VKDHKEEMKKWPLLLQQREEIQEMMEGQGGR